MMHFGVWDVTLVVAVTLQSTLLAYLYNPRWKAFLLTLPIPFTVAALALNHPIDTTNVLGMALLLGFAHGVRILHYRWRCPIVAAIALAALGYCVVATLTAKVLPRTEPSFWVTVAGVMLLAAGVLKIFPTSDELGHRTPLPLWIKTPAIMAVIIFIVCIKYQLQGFMTAFPMVSVVAAYEARHSLRTMSRQVSIVLLTMTPMIAAIHVLQGRLGLPGALAAGWVLFLMILFPTMHVTGASPFRRTVCEPA